MKVLLTGSSGVIGKQLLELFYLKTRFEILTPSKSELDLRDFSAVNKYFDLNKPDICVLAHGRSGWRTENPDAVTSFENILMFDNICRAKHFETKVINFGTGAEFDTSLNIDNKTSKIPSSNYYGFSKRIITSLCQTYYGVYNLRIFGCFGSMESSDRFIKRSILNYIDKKPIEIFQNRYFSYIYINDLFTIIQSIIENRAGYNIFDCVYSKETTLLDIANIINKLDKYEVIINIQNEGLAPSYLGNPYYDKFYFGKMVDEQFDLMGLERGIRDMYDIFTVPF